MDRFADISDQHHRALHGRVFAVALNASAEPERAYGAALALNTDGGVPEWIELIPAGPEIVGRDGRRWRMSDPAKLAAAFAANRADLPIDWEHAQFTAAPTGKEAPASGWINQMEARNGALWGRVSWTPRGAAAVTAREYRYISPVFAFDAATREITALKAAGLVNRPNLDLPALNTEGLPIMWKKLLAALGLPETATEDDAVAAVAALKNEKETALNQAKSPPLNLFVPRADYEVALNRATAAEGEMTTFKASIREAEVKAMVDDAVAKGQIAPATKEYHLAACRTDDGRDAFKAMIAKVPVNPAAQASGLDDKKPGAGATALNAEEIAVCRQLGMSEDEFIKSRG